jgi:hypothetical protein
MMPWRTPPAARRLVVSAAAAATLLVGLGTTGAAASQPVSPAHGSPAGTFPGDPGRGRVVLGVAGTNISGHEQAGGKKLAHRLYFNKGISDFAVPAGPIARAILAEQAAGRIPVVSEKTGIAATATGRYDAQLRAFFAWADALPRTTFVIIHHEPENDAKGQGAAAQHQLAADFRAAQQHVRAALDAATSGHPKHVSFGGSLMTYSLSKQGRAKFAPIDEFYPGPGVWDWVGWDHYNEVPSRPLEDLLWREALATSARWKLRPAVTELGVRPEDRQGDAKLKAFYCDAIRLGLPFVLYYDSNVNSTGSGWTLAGAARTAWWSLVRTPRTATPNA